MSLALYISWGREVGRWAWPSQYPLVFPGLLPTWQAQEESRQDYCDPTGSEFNPTAPNHFQFAKAGYYLYQSEAWLKTESSPNGSNAKTLTGTIWKDMGRAKRKKKKKTKEAEAKSKGWHVHSSCFPPAISGKDRWNTRQPGGLGDAVGRSASLGRERGRMDGVPVGKQPTVPPVLDNGSTRVELGCFHSQTSTLLF